MDISVDLKKKDLVAVNFYMFPRLRGNWVFFILLTAGIFAYIFFARKPRGAYDIATAAFSALAGGIAASVFTVVSNLLRTLFTVGKDSDVLGVHHYSISEQGLEERTTANETLHTWKSIQSITKLPGCILIRINSYLFHIVPRRAFATDEEFNSFYQRATALQQAA
ncbi:YcxB family protein [Undibacterium terreum]|uniref:YcxB-like C-terminal domain-containing protein n=1 Tax=Undibacterium terreum TaxID=1224302 RepID=A0A916U950_9BURK|nr:YcxB family protein [Undibacterium terreum]GGC64836.1 hypothetical protein GCM10011396_09830 [Undibacterium terreum]